jgi:uncharacterized protein YggE
MSETISKRIYYLSAIAIVALVLIGVFAAARPIIVQTPGSNSTKTLQANGVGTVSATPDEVQLYLAVETQAATATQATQDNAGTMTQVMQALVNAGVSRDSISTVSYTLTPTYNSSNNDQTTPTKIIGYIARNSIQVTLTNSSHVGMVLDTAVAAGANEVGGITFTFTSQTYANLQKQALQLAIQDASGQAQSMATVLGVHIVAPISVTTGYSYQPSIERMATSNAQTPIQPGTLQIAANVQITYEISST